MIRQLRLFHTCFYAALAGFVAMNPLPQEPRAMVHTAAPYDFTDPVARFDLPPALREISGLTVLNDHHLGAVEDERGMLYVLDFRDGSIVRRTAFGKKGDYEGVERAGDAVFVLRSDGTLFRLEGWRATHSDAEKIDTPLSSKYDTEGLAVDAAGKRLLIACKEYPGKHLKGQRSVYAFDLKRQALRREPVLVMDRRAVLDHLEGNDRVGDRLTAFLQRFSDADGFKPSALAVHPLTGDLYVLSSVLRVIAVYSPAGVLRAVWPLQSALFEQPEGLAFLPDGDLFIASEGRRRPARLARFAYRP